MRGVSVFGFRSRSNSVDIFMPCRGNDLLPHKCFIAYRTMFPICHPGFGAGSGEPAVDDFRVAVGRDDLLFYKNFTAD